MVYSRSLWTSTVPIPAHQSGKRAGSYNSFQTSSGAPAEIAEAMNDGIGNPLQVGARTFELACGIDQSDDRPPEVAKSMTTVLADLRPPEVGQDRGHALGVDILGEP